MSFPLPNIFLSFNGQNPAACVLIFTSFSVTKSIYFIENMKMIQKEAQVALLQWVGCFPPVNLNGKSFVPWKKKEKKISDTFPVQDGELTHAFNLHSLLSLIKMTVGVFVKLQGWRKWEQQNFGNGKTAEHVRIDVADLRKLSLKLAGEGATDSLAYVETPPFPSPGLGATRCLWELE